MTDQLDQLFADLRAETIPEVRPPGAGAARRTVRRRRLVSTCAGGLAVAAVAGLAVGLPNGLGTPAAEPAPPGVLNDRGQQASAAVGTPHWAGPNAVLALHDAAAMTRTQQVADATYVARVACIGPGTVEVAINTATIDVPCAASGTAQLATQLEVTAEAGVIRVVVSPDAAAAGQSAVAYQLALTDRDRTWLQDQARAALAATPVGGNAHISTDLITGRSQIAPTRPAAGHYRLDLGCVGVGFVTVGVDLITSEGQVVAPVAARPLACTEKSAVTSVTFTVPSKNRADQLQVLLNPDQTATGQVAVAWRLVKL